MDHMIKVRIIATGEIREVTKNEAFDLTSRNLAEQVKPESPEAHKKQYNTRQMRPRSIK